MLELYSKMTAVSESSKSSQPDENIVYKAKYIALARECATIERQSCRHAEQIYQMNKVIKRLEKEKGFLIHKLDGFNDDYKSAKKHFLAEEEVKLISSLSSGESSNFLSSKKKKAKKRLCGAPKKPSNAFLIFCQRRRAQLQAQHEQQHKTEISRKEITKVLAEMWKDLDDKEKEKYYALYKEDKQRYAEEMKQFQNSQKPDENAGGSNSEEPSKE